MPLNADEMSDEELLAQVVLLGAEIVDAGNVWHQDNGRLARGFYWMENHQSAMDNYHETLRGACRDFLAYKGVIDGPTKGLFGRG